MTREECLKRAEVCVCGQREQDYGSPEDSFDTIAKLWSAYLGEVLEDVLSLRAVDVAAMMALLKIARIGGERAMTKASPNISVEMLKQADLEQYKSQHKDSIVSVSWQSFEFPKCCFSCKYHDNVSGRCYGKNSSSLLFVTSYLYSCHKWEGGANG